MTHKLTALVGVCMCAGLAACSTPETNTQELSQQTIEYNCGQGNTQPLSVQYTFQGDEPLAAKVIHNNQAVDLIRATTNNVDTVGNTFRGNGHTWTTGKFSRVNVGTVDGDMLTQEVQQQDANGQTTIVSNVLLRDCRVAGAS